MRNLYSTNIGIFYDMSLGQTGMDGVVSNKYGPLLFRINRSRITQYNDVLFLHRSEPSSILNHALSNSSHSCHHEQPVSIYTTHSGISSPCPLMDRLSSSRSSPPSPNEPREITNHSERDGEGKPSPRLSDQEGNKAGFQVENTSFSLALISPNHSEQNMT